MLRTLLLSSALGLSLLFGATSTQAQSKKAKPTQATTKKANKTKAAKAKDRAKSKTAKGKAEDERPGKAEGKDRRPLGAKKTTGSGPNVVDVKETGEKGVKTYKFGPVDVEGRLKSPQVVYFLRRVRAEFAAGKLGHRSFMRELSDTRRHSALR